jgi:hypothetical protein
VRGTWRPPSYVEKLLSGGGIKVTKRAWQVPKGVFDMPALEGLASEPGSGQPELGPERPVALFDVVVWFEPG